MCVAALYERKPCFMSVGESLFTKDLREKSIPYTNFASSS